MQFDVVSVRLSAQPSQASCKEAVILLDTGMEIDRRLQLLHENVKKCGKVFNAVAPGTELAGVMHRKAGSA